MFYKLTEGLEPIEKERLSCIISKNTYDKLLTKFNVRQEENEAGAYYFGIFSCISLFLDMNNIKKTRVETSFKMTLAQLPLS